MKMYKDKTLSSQNLKRFNYEETKGNVKDYFNNLEILEWQWVKLNAQKGLVANYNFETEYRNHQYIQIGKDIFNLSAKEMKEEELIEYL